MRGPVFILPIQIPVALKINVNLTACSGSSIRNPVSAPSPTSSPAEFAPPCAFPLSSESTSQPKSQLQSRPHPQPQAEAPEDIVDPTEKGMAGENLLFSGDWALVDGCMDNSPKSSRKNSCSSLREMETELRRRSEVESVLRHETDSGETSRCTSRGEERSDLSREEENVKRDGLGLGLGLRKDEPGHVRWNGSHAS
jgi:hypothetical protein